MLSFSEEQYALFKEKYFCAMVADEVAKRCPDVVKDQPRQTFENKVSLGVRRARCYALEGLNAYVTFVELMFTVAPLFDNHPACAEVLTNSQISANRRMATLFQYDRQIPWGDISNDPQYAGWLDVEPVKGGGAHG